MRRIGMQMAIATLYVGTPDWEHILCPEQDVKFQICSFTLSYVKGPPWLLEPYLEMSEFYCSFELFMQERSPRGTGDAGKASS